MDAIYKNFYRNFYQHTGGFIPAQVMEEHIYPGDFFQIRNGALIVLGNIFRNLVIDPEACRFENAIPLNPAFWKFSQGVSKPYSGRGAGRHEEEHFEFSTQRLAFESRGSFLFNGNGPEAIRMANWNDFQQQLLIRMTQVFYSFRELYMVTETAATASWSLAVAGSDRGELEIATSHDNFGLADIFGHDSARTVQSKDIEFYHRDERRRPVFFKAKKLVARENSRDGFINSLWEENSGRDQWAGEFFAYPFDREASYRHAVNTDAQASMLDMLRPNDLTPNTVLHYFKWEDTSLDDIERFFVNYGN